MNMAWNGEEGTNNQAMRAISMATTINSNMKGHLDAADRAMQLAAKAKARLEYTNDVRTKLCLRNANEFLKRFFFFIQVELCLSLLRSPNLSMLSQVNPRICRLAFDYINFSLLQSRSHLLYINIIITAAL